MYGYKSMIAGHKVQLPIIATIIIKLEKKSEGRL